MEKCASFSPFLFFFVLFFRKVNVLKNQIFLQFLDKIRWMTERVKNGLQKSMLNISHWTMRLPRVEQSRFMAIKSRHGLNTRSEKETTFAKYSNQTLKSHPYKLGCVNRFHVWHPHKHKPTVFIWFIFQLQWTMKSGWLFLFSCLSSRLCYLMPKYKYEN